MINPSGWNRHALLCCAVVVLGQVNRTVCVLGVPKTMEESELHEIFPGLMTVTGEDKTGTSTG